MKEKIRYNLEMALANKDLVQSFKTMSLRILGVVVLFGFSLFLTNNYDPKIIGQYDFIQKILLVVSSICILGTDQSILYFAGILKNSNNEGTIKIIYKKIVGLILLICLGVFTAFIIIGEFFTSLIFNDDDTYNLLFKTIVVLFFYSLTLFNTETLRALGRVYLAELFRNIFKYFSVIFGSIILLLMHLENYLVDFFLLGFVFLAVITSAIIFQTFKKEQYILEKQTESNLYTNSYIISKSYPMAISNFAIFLMMTLDIILLKKYKGDETVAYYAIAMKVVSVLYMIGNSVFISVSLKVAQLFMDSNKLALQKTLKQSSRIIFMLTLPVVIIVCLLSEQILGFFGAAYVQAKEALLILVLGQLIASTFGLSTIYLNMTGRQKIFQMILILAVLINFVLNIILIPLYSLSGAAISLTISLLFWNSLTAFIIYKKDKLVIVIH
jgi:O-antigen/teichoic acid export membrane protein